MWRVLNVYVKHNRPILSYATCNTRMLEVVPLRLRPETAKIWHVFPGKKKKKIKLIRRYRRAWPENWEYDLNECIEQLCKFLDPSKVCLEHQFWRGKYVLADKNKTTKWKQNVRMGLKGGCATHARFVRNAHLPSVQSWMFILKAPGQSICFKLNFGSDNATVFNSFEMLPFVNSMNKCNWFLDNSFNARVTGWMFSEPQDGKGPVDVHFSYWGRVFSMWVADKQDLLEAKHILSAFKRRPLKNW